MQDTPTKFPQASWEEIPLLEASKSKTFHGASEFRFILTVLGPKIVRRTVKECKAYSRNVMETTAVSAGAWYLSPE